MAVDYGDVYWQVRLEDMSEAEFEEWCGLLRQESFDDGYQDGVNGP